MRTRIIVIVITAFIAIVIASSKLTAQDKNNPAVDFTVTDTEGITVNLFDELANGKTVMLFFFSTACGGCHIEAPRVDSIYRQFGSGQDKLLVWGIADLSSSPDEVIEFISETGVSFPCFTTGHDPDVFNMYNVTYTPQAIIICDYISSESISFFEIIENLNYCFPTNVRNEKTPSPIINIIGNSVNIELKQPTSSIKVYDITGRLADNIMTINSNTCNIENLKSGNLYILNFIFTDGKSFSEKIFIK